MCAQHNKLMSVHIHPYTRTHTYSNTSARVPKHSRKCDVCTHILTHVSKLSRMHSHAHLNVNLPLSKLQNATKLWLSRLFINFKPTNIPENILLWRSRLFINFKPTDRPENILLWLSRLFINFKPIDMPEITLLWLSQNFG